MNPAGPVENSGIVFILNGTAGSNRANEAQGIIVRVAAEATTSVRVEVAHSGAELRGLARQAVEQRARMVVAGGGDGTVNAVASEVLGSEAVLGVLPLGTLNHFAKDLAIPLDIAAAVQNIFHGRLVSVDVADVNGRIFLNNSSLGVYPQLVRYREAVRSKGQSKWLAFARAVVAVMRRHALFHARLQIGGGEVVSRATAFVFVGNNEYEKTGFRIGARKALDTGNLWICLPRHGGRTGLLRLALRALVGRLRADDLHELCATEIVIQTGKPRPSVATDGEVDRMTAPLRYRVRPGALRVIVPLEESREPAALSSDLAALPAQTIVPNRAPTPAVTPMASAPQNVTRQAP